MWQAETDKNYLYVFTDFMVLYLRRPYRSTIVDACDMKALMLLLILIVCIHVLILSCLGKGACPNYFWKN